MMLIRECATSRAAHEVEAVLAEMREARTAARRLGALVVERALDGEWRAAIPCRGARDAQTRVNVPPRQWPAPTGLDHDRARRLRVAEAEATINPLALGRRDTVRPFWLGFGVSR